MAAGLSRARLQLGRAARLGGARRRLAAAPLLLYAAGIAWTLFYDTIYAHQDREDDALIGVNSTARLFGGGDQALARRLPPRLRGSPPRSPRRASAAPALAAALPGVSASPLHLGWQLRRLDIDDPAVCLMLFRSNRDAGLILTAALLGAAIL